MQIFAAEQLRTGRGAVVPWDGHLAAAHLGVATWALDFTKRKATSLTPLRSVRGFEYIFQKVGARAPRIYPI